MATGITFKLLHVDLGTRQTRVEEIPATRSSSSGSSTTNAVTGWNMSLFEMMKVGEHANTMMRVV